MSWREIQRTNFRNISDLSAFLELELEKTHFPLNLPRRLANKMAKNTFDDPLVRQFVPQKQEKEKTPGFDLDPVQDTRFCKANKLLKKYERRVLLLTNSSCAMHCRYCFRQNFDYAHSLDMEEELNFIRNDLSIQEVILSGGDPLSLSNRVLGQLMEQLCAISHLQLIRFHTRFPIGIPERIDSSFLSLLETCSKQIVFVLHANHPNEFDKDIFSALKEVQKLGIPTLLQSILLKGINDNFSTLKHLFEMCIYHGIIPYYLHQLDRVTGAAHFDVPEEQGMALIQQLRDNLPGYAVPRYVREIAGEKSKTLI
jgi:EF-P beta-lysylation protein EpmB